MTTPAMLELPEPELGYIETDKSRQPAFSARQMREALQSQPAAAVSDEEIWGLWDSQERTGLVGGPCPVKFARAILALRPAQQAPEWDGGKPANLQAAARDADEWLALIQRLNDAGRWLFSQPDSRPKLDGCRAALSKILCAPAQQAVPMTDEQFTQLLRKLKRSREVFQAGRDSYETACAPMNSDDEAWFAYLAHHGITQRADGGEQQA